MNSPKIFVRFLKAFYIMGYIGHSRAHLHGLSGLQHSVINVFREWVVRGFHIPRLTPVSRESRRDLQESPGLGLGEWSLTQTMS